MKCLEFETKGAKKNQCTFGSFVDRLFKFLVLNTLCIWTTGTHFWYIFLSVMKFFGITDDLWSRYIWLSSTVCRRSLFKFKFFRFWPEIDQILIKKTINPKL